MLLALDSNHIIRERHLVMSRRATTRCRGPDLVLAVDNFTSQATRAVRQKRTPVWVASEDLTNFDIHTFDKTV